MAVMVLAMLDVVTGSSLFPVVWWSAAIVATSVALAVHRRRAAPVRVPAMRLHAALSGVVMGTTMLVMAHAHGSAVSGAHHGVSARAILVVLAAAATIVAASAVWRSRRGHPLERAQHASTAASLLLLAAASFA